MMVGLFPSLFIQKQLINSEANPQILGHMSKVCRALGRFVYSISPAARLQTDWK